MDCVYVYWLNYISIQGELCLKDNATVAWTKGNDVGL